jgi:hypothetical protein
LRASALGQAYRAAVAGHVAQNDYLAAARLLESKLDAPDEAQVQLNAGWPSAVDRLLRCWGHFRSDHQEGLRAGA